MYWLTVFSMAMCGSVLGWYAALLVKKRSSRGSYNLWHKGYDWAAGMLLRGHKTFEQLEFGAKDTNSPFDAGVLAAVHDAQIRRWFARSPVGTPAEPIKPSATSAQG